jgi:hypothetical protein
MKNFLEKIKKLPEGRRKMILWSAVIIIGLGLFVWYFKNMKSVFFNQGNLQDNLKLQDLKEDLKNLPEF